MRLLRFLLPLWAIALSLNAFAQSRLTAQPHARPNPALSRESAIRGHRRGYQIGAPWPKFQANGSNTGLGTGGGSNGLVYWANEPSESSFSSPVVGADGTIYISGYISGNLYSLGSDGALNWTSPTGDWQLTTPCIGADGTIYTSGASGGVFATSPAGSLIWSYSTGTYNLSATAIGSDGSIYVGGGNGTVYAVSSAGALEWTCSTGDRFLSSPAIGADGTIYVTGGNGGVYAVTSAGSIAWSHHTGESYLSPASIGADGTIYVGGPSSGLYSISTSGSVNWTTSAGYQNYLSCPAVAPDGTIIVKGDDGGVYAIRPNGSKRWHYYTNDSAQDYTTPVSSPAIGSDGSVYVVGTGSKGGIYGLDQYGNLVWKHLTSDASLSSPAIGAVGTVYVGTGGGYGVGGGTGSILAIGTEVNTVPVSGLTVNPDTVTGGDTSTGTVTLSSPAPSGGDIVALVSGDLSVIVPPFVAVPGGATTADFNILTKPVSTNTAVIITATSGGANATATLTVQTASPILVTLNPSSVPGGGASTATVTLNGVAGPSGDVVNLQTSDSTIAVTPATVTVPAGALSTTFPVTALSSGTTQTVLVMATLNGTASATLTVTPGGLQGVSTSQLSIVGGDYPNGTVTLYTPAPAGGSVVTLSTDNPLVVVPSTVTVAAGNTTASFVVQTFGVDANTPVTITATLGSTTKNCVLTLLPASALWVTVSPNTVVGGSSTTVTGTLKLNGKAGPSGVVVSLASSNTSSASVPATVTVAGSTSSVQFPVTTYSVASQQPVTISGTANTTVSTTLTVNPGSIVSVSVTPTAIVGGDSPNPGVVTISVPAPASGIVVNLSTNSPYVTVPATVTVAGGATTGTFSVKTLGVDVSTPTTITATFGASTKTCNLTLLPTSALSVTVSPTVVVGGSATTVTGTVHLNGKAGPSGVVVTLSSSIASAATLPATVTVPAGAGTAQFPVTTYSVTSPKGVTLSATATTTVSTGLTVNPPGGLSSISISPSSIVGGDSPNGGTVTLNAPAPAGGAVVTLSSANSSLVSVPGSVTVAAGSATATFAVTTGGISATTQVVVTGTYLVSQSCTETLLPASAYSLAVSPTTVIGGTATTVTGLFHLNGKSGPGGAVVSLSSSNTSAASVPATVTVAAGTGSITFPVTTYAVSSDQSVTLSASYNGVTVTALLTVKQGSIVTIKINPSAIVGGDSPQGGVVTLNAPAPVGGASVTLSSANSGLVGVPASVTVAAGATTASFPVTTGGVDVTTQVVVTGTYGGSATCTPTLNPASALSLTVNPTSVVGGPTVTVTGLFHLNGKSGPSGAVISLSSSNTSAATVPATATVAPGTGSITFPITTYAVGSSQSVTISATYNGMTVTATLLVTNVIT